MNQHERARRHVDELSQVALLKELALFHALDAADRLWVEQEVLNERSVEEIGHLAALQDFGPAYVGTLAAYALHVWARGPAERVSLAEPVQPAKAAGWIKPREGESER